MIARALRKIEADLARLLAEPDLITEETLAQIRRQVAAQAEMLELGLEE